MNKELLEKIDNMIERIAMTELHTGKSEDILIDKNTLLDIKKELELKALVNSSPSEALECLEKLDNMQFHRSIDTYVPEIKREISETQYLDNTNEFYTIKQALIKAQEQEKENELLKEIIKSLFDNGCPLHQYIDDKFGLTIEVDDECSIMQLGEFKGIDLDKKLKEVLE